MKNIILFLSFLFVSNFGTSQIRVVSNGSVGMGNVLNPQTALHLGGPLGIARIDRNTNNGGAAFLLVKKNAANTAIDQAFTFASAKLATGEKFFVIGDYGTNPVGVSQRRFVIDSDGDVSINGPLNPSHKLHVDGTAFKTQGGGNWSVPSDKRLKKNIKAYNRGLDIIMKLNPMEYEYNGKAGTVDGEFQIGAMAQDVQKVAPFMVNELELTFDDNTFDVYGNDETNAKSKTEKFLSLNTSSLEWILVNAVKEQQSIIDDLQIQIAEIKDAIASYEANNRNNIPVELSDSSNSSLRQNKPNPYDNETIIEYNVAVEGANSFMNFYNLNGQLIKSVSLQSGQGTVSVNADDLPSGTYTYSLEVDGKLVSNKKMIKMR